MNDERLAAWLLVRGHQQPREERRRIEDAGAEHAGSRGTQSRALPTISGTSYGMRTPSWVVLRDVKTFVDERHHRAGDQAVHDRSGDPAAIRPVTPKTAAANTIAPASIEAPASSGKES